MGRQRLEASSASSSNNELGSSGTVSYMIFTCVMEGPWCRLRTDAVASYQTASFTCHFVGFAMPWVICETREDR